jgi:Zn-dependent protease with chaperone function
MLAATLMLLAFAACGKPGVDAGGETNASNGGVAFMVLTGFLVVGAIIMWFILGREE